MENERRFSRRSFFTLSAAAGVAAAGTGRLWAAEDLPATSAATLAAPLIPQARFLADKFVQWQNPYGRLDPQRCPVAAWGPRIISHSFIAFGLYRAFQMTGVEAYQAAADRYVLFYLSWIREPPHVHPAHYGLGLAAYRAFKRHNPKEMLLDDRAAGFFEGLLAFRWDEGSHFRNGYPGGKMEDAANSDDNCHMGRGLMGYYEVAEKPEVLAEAEALARYFTTEVKPGTYQGCWSSKLGTWVVAPTGQDRFEHFENVSASAMGWGFSSVGAIEYLTELAAVTENEDLRARIANNCATSMKWQFDACQFDDGACGLSGRDDKWLGMTAGAILSFLRTRQARFLSEEEIARYRPKALAARDWLLEHVTEEDLAAGGYLRVTGKSHKKTDNLAWILGWTLDALCRVEEI